MVDMLVIDTEIKHIHSEYLPFIKECNNWCIIIELYHNVFRNISSNVYQYRKPNPALISHPPSQNQRARHICIMEKESLPRAAVTFVTRLRLPRLCFVILVVVAELFSPENFSLADLLRRCSAPRSYMLYANDVERDGEEKKTQFRNRSRCKWIVKALPASARAYIEKGDAAQSLAQSKRTEWGRGEDRRSNKSKIDKSSAEARESLKSVRVMPLARERAKFLRDIRIEYCAGGVLCIYMRARIYARLSLSLWARPSFVLPSDNEMHWINCTRWIWIFYFAAVCMYIYVGNRVRTSLHGAFAIIHVGYVICWNVKYKSS